MSAWPASRRRPAWPSPTPNRPAPCSLELCGAAAVMAYKKLTIPRDVYASLASDAGRGELVVLIRDGRVEAITWPETAGYMIEARSNDAADRAQFSTEPLRSRADLDRFVELPRRGVQA